MKICVHNVVLYLLYTVGRWCLQKRGVALVRLSMGEVLDRISILDVKMMSLPKHTRHCFLKRERDLLWASVKREASYPRVYALYGDLLDVNKGLWVLEDSIRVAHGEQDKDSVVGFSRAIIKENARRASIKSSIMSEYLSDLTEVKRYASTGEDTKESA